MKQIEVESVEIIDDELGHRLKRGKRIETFTDEQVRHCDLCTMCGFPGYPECRDWCQNEQWAREKAKNRG